MSGCRQIYGLLEHAENKKILKSEVGFSGELRVILCQADCLTDKLQFIGEFINEQTVQT